MGPYEQPRDISPIHPLVPAQPDPVYQESLEPVVGCLYQDLMRCLAGDRSAGEAGSVRAQEHPAAGYFLAGDQDDPGVLRS